MPARVAGHSKDTTPECEEASACRKGFPEVQVVTSNVMRAMRKARGAPIPLEKAALCVTLDVIGRVGFQKDFGATAGFEAALEGTASLPAGRARRSMLERAWDRICEELGVWLHTHVEWADTGLGVRLCRIAAC